VNPAIGASKSGGSTATGPMRSGRSDKGSLGGVGSAVSIPPSVAGCRVRPTPRRVPRAACCQHRAGCHGPLAARAGIDAPFGTGRQAASGTQHVPAKKRSNRRKTPYVAGLGKRQPRCLPPEPPGSRPRLAWAVASFYNAHPGEKRPLRLRAHVRFPTAPDPHSKPTPADCGRRSLGTAVSGVQGDSGERQYSHKGTRR
jgi:hypothetical protein